MQQKQGLRRSVTIAVPTYRNMPSMFFWNFLGLENFNRKRFALRITGCDNTLVDAARNTVINQYLRVPSDYLFFLDSDMLVPQDAIECLAVHDKDMVSAAYFGRSQAGETHPMAFSLENGEYARLGFLPDGLTEVSAVGLGCCLIKKEVIVSLAESLGEEPLFRVVQESRNSFKGEDIYFCELARKHGFGVFIDPAVQCGHIGGVIDLAYYKANKPAVV